MILHPDVSDILSPATSVARASSIFRSGFRSRNSHRRINLKWMFCFSCMSKRWGSRLILVHDFTPDSHFSYKEAAVQVRQQVAFLFSLLSVDRNELERRLRTSTAWTQEVDPRVSLVSVETRKISDTGGESENFGHLGPPLPASVVHRRRAHGVMQGGTGVAHKITPGIADAGLPLAFASDPK